jgi:hypothetical protein
MTTQERLDQLREQQRQAEVNFHQITGAIAVMEQQLADEQEAPKETPKEEGKKK